MGAFSVDMGNDGFSDMSDFRIKVAAKYSEKELRVDPTSPVLSDQAHNLFLKLLLIIDSDRRSDAVITANNGAIFALDGPLRKGKRFNGAGD